MIVAHTGTGGERGRIMSPDGISVALSATDYKDPPKVLEEEKEIGRQNNRSCGIYDPYNKALYKMICPTLLASDYKHLKYVIEEL